MIVDSNFVLSSLTFSDYPLGGPIGTAALTVDVVSSVIITQTTVGQVLSAPPPTDTTAGLFLTVTNNGSSSFSISGTSVIPGSYITIFWNGSFWASLSNPSTTGLTQVYVSSFTVSSLTNQVVPLVGNAGTTQNLFVNGVRQPGSSYSILGSTLTVFASTIWVGANCDFEYNLL